MDTAMPKPTCCWMVKKCSVPPFSLRQSEACCLQSEKQSLQSSMVIFFCCLKLVAPGDAFAWAGFWQHDLIIMLKRCSSCLYTDILAIQMSTLFVILKSGWYQSESFFFWLAFSKGNLREFSIEAAAATRCICLSFNHLAILGLKMLLLFLGLLESCEMTANGDNAFLLMCIHYVIGFMFYILCLLPRKLLLRGRWNQRRGVFVM